MEAVKRQEVERIEPWRKGRFGLWSMQQAIGREAGGDPYTRMCIGLRKDHDVAEI